MPCELTSSVAAPLARRGLPSLLHLAAVAGMFALSGAALADDRIPMVERTMRRLQTRVHAADRNTVLDWPDCCEGSKTPPYPKNDYYDSAIDGNEDRALALVKRIYDHFYTVLPSIVGSYLKDEDGLDSLGPNMPPYMAPRLVYPGGTGNPADFDELPEPDLDNYPEVLAALDADILRLDALIAEVTPRDFAKRSLVACDDCGVVDPIGGCGGARDASILLADAEWGAWDAENPPSALGFGESHKTSEDAWAVYAAFAGRGRFEYDAREVPGEIRLFGLFTVCPKPVNYTPDPLCAQPVHVGFQPPVSFTNYCDDGKYQQFETGDADQVFRSPMYGDTGEMSLGEVLTLDCSDITAEDQNPSACWGLDGVVAGVDLDPDTEPDDKDCGEDCGSCPPGQPKVSLGSVSIMFPLGRNDSQTSFSAGFIRMRAGTMQSWLGAVEGLAPILGYGAIEEVTITEDGVVTLRQFATPYIVASFEQVSGSSFTAKFFHVDDVVKPVDRYIPDGAASPFTTTTVTYEDGTFTDPRTPAETAAGARLTIITTGMGAAKWVYVQVKDAERDDWSLASGYTSGGTPLKVESLLMDPWDGDEQVRTRLIADGGGAAAYRQVEKYARFSWGTELTERRTGASTAEWVETWSFYDDSGDPAACYGMLKQYTSPSGSWERYFYEDQSGTSGIVAPKLSKVVSQFLDGAYDEGNPTTSENNNRVATLSTNRSINLSGGPSHGGNEIIDIRAEKLLGQEIARSYTIHWSYNPLATPAPKPQVWHIEAAMPGTPGSLATALNAVCAAPISSEHPVSITVRELEAPYHTLVSVSPDGSRSEYTRTTSGTDQILTVLTNRVGDDLDPRGGPGATRTVTTRNARGSVLSRVTEDLSVTGEEIVVASEVNSDIDEFGRAWTTTYLDETYSERSYDCCGLVSETDREGSTTSYTYDELKRVRTTARELPGGDPLTTEWTYDAAGNIVQERRIPDEGDTIVTRQSEYDLSGRLASETDALGNITTYAYAIDTGGMLVETRTLPDPDYVDSENDGPLASPTVITMSYPDGQMHSTSGTGVHPSSYAHGVAWDATYGQCRYTTAYRGTAETEWVRTYVNALGQGVRTEYPGSVNARTEYDTFGRAFKQTDPDGVVTLSFMGYGTADIPSAWVDEPSGIWNGCWSLSVQDYDDDGLPDFNGLDRITLSRSELYERETGVWVNRSTTIAWTTESDADDLYTASVTDVTVDGLCGWHEADGQTTETVITYSRTQAEKAIVTIDPVGVEQWTVTHHGQQVSSSRIAPGPVNMGSTQTIYDEHGRVEQTRLIYSAGDPDSDAVTDYTYDDLDRVLTQEDPEPNWESPAFGRRLTTTTYDNLGRVVQVEHPNSNVTYTSYSATGEVAETYGFGVNPVRYEYDDLGRLWKLKTYKDASGDPWTGEAVTTWTYSSTRGTLTSKAYNSGGGPAYLYSDAGRVTRKTNQRSIQANYTYGPHGDVTVINYNDTTQDVTLTYDRLGRIKTVKDAAGLRTFTYDDGGRMLTEEIATATGAGNLLSGVTVTNTYDSTTKLRTAHNTAKSTLSKTVNYGYDSLRRMDHVHKDTLHARFLYDNVTGQVTKTTYVHDDDDPSGNPVVTGERTFDRLGRLTALDWTTNTIAASTITDIAGFGYEHDEYGRRIKMNLPVEGTFWNYDYDSMNQLTSASHQKLIEEENVQIPGETTAYIYDHIGNRQATSEGGGDGQTPYTAGYTSNLLNQYTARDVPEHVEVVGRTSSDSIEGVEVNEESAWRNAQIYAKRVTFDNSTDPVLEPIQVSEYIGASLIRTSWWDAFLPKDPESFYYDADGNLALDGIWAYEWDAENRLTRMQMRDEAAEVLLANSSTWVAIDFAYDWMGRRISKVYQTSASDPSESGGKYGPPILWSIDKVTRYVYDGWMLSMSYRGDVLSGPFGDQSFAWGPDLSGGYGGAGGIGGLVAYTDDEHDALNPSSLSSDPDFLGPMFPIYDGNGNIVKMVRFETNSGSTPFAVKAFESAAYEYGPFGENRSTTGELGSPAEGGTHQGQRNPFRFSTKYTDAETGLIYYGYRYYSPSMGRWISRDPVGEADGPSVYSFARNRPTIAGDPLGLWTRNGDWRMLRPGSYEGSARSGCGDTLEDLAYYITGRRGDAAYIIYDAAPRDRLYGGASAGIGPLLRVLEERLRRLTVNYSRTYSSGFGASQTSSVRNLGENGIRAFFIGGGSSADCSAATELVQGRALIDELKPGEFDLLFEKLRGVPHHPRDVTNIANTLNGDAFAMPNDRDYTRLQANWNSARVRRWEEGGREGPRPQSVNDWMAEFVIRTGANEFFAHGLDPKIRHYTAKQIREHMLGTNNALRDFFGEARQDLNSIPKSVQNVQFLDIVDIAQRTFDHRNEAK